MVSLSSGLSEGSAGSLRGFCGVSAGFCRGPRDFPRVGGSDPMLVTLRNCWRFFCCLTIAFPDPHENDKSRFSGRG